MRGTARLWNLWLWSHSSCKVCWSTLENMRRFSRFSAPLAVPAQKCTPFMPVLAIWPQRQPYSTPRGRVGLSQEPFGDIPSLKRSPFKWLHDTRELWPFGQASPLQTEAIPRPVQMAGIITAQESFTFYFSNQELHELFLVSTINCFYILKAGITMLLEGRRNSLTGSLQAFQQNRCQLCTSERTTLFLDEVSKNFNT